MKWMIASDLHGSFYYAKEMERAFFQEQADKLLLLGDLLYHGPRNDLPKEYNPKEVIPLLNRLKEKIFCVRGNCDAEVDQMVLEFPIMADSMVLELGGRTVFATHGHIYHQDALPPLGAGAILLHGHTHLQVMEQLPGGVLYLNPGSLAIPKGGSCHSYMIYEDSTFTIKELESGDPVSSLKV